ncbi:MAG: hypothetical protein QOJ65_2768 [Fimbriimonadaceae bacterium]|jgi:cystathionine beta-lyase/cystathionine gamma-synthase|nr:hypothetical protein [Fimbriimonadaceae bacterium]
MNDHRPTTNGGKLLLQMRLPDDARLSTLLQHFAEEEKPFGAVTPPLYQNSLFVFEDSRELSDLLVAPDYDAPHVYSRISNPTLEVVEKKMAMLEGTEAAKVISSGMVAISAAVLSSVEQGAHIVGLDTNYSPTISLLRDFLPRFGVSTTFVDGRCTEDLFDAITPDTKLVYLESPSTAFLRLQDLEAIATECRKRGITTICDNSYSTPLFQQPHKVGIDIVVHSASKYLGGHSDITAGVICASKLRINQMLKPAGEIPLISGTLAPFSAWLLGRGLRTLELRLKAHERTGNEIATWLDDNNAVDVVHHPGLPSYPQRELFRKQMKGSTGLLSFEPKTQDREKALDFANALRVFQRGISWGGFESLAHPMLSQPSDYKEPRNVIRLYCGLEDPADLIADLDQAFRVSGLG